MDPGERLFDAFDGVVEHPHVPGELLPQGQRRCILHVSAADLDDLVPSLGLDVQRVAQRAHRGQELGRRRHPGGDTHGGREGVVGRLRHIHMVVRMHRVLRAEWRAGKLAAAIGDHLVHVHVELGAAAGHPDMERKLIWMLPRQDFVAGPRDQPMPTVIKPTGGVVDMGCGFLQHRISAHHLPWDQIFTNIEVLQRALSLRAP